MSYVFQVGDRVVKNPATWKPSAFDAWAGIGTGEVLCVEVAPGIVDVRWPGGRCYQYVDELTLHFKPETDGEFSHRLRDVAPHE